jgi:hypothetical protein
MPRFIVGEPTRIAMGIGQTIALEILDFAKDKIILDK